MAQNGLQNRCSNFDQISASFWTLLGAKMGAKMSPKIFQKPASEPQGRPEASREPFWSHLGSIWESIGEFFGQDEVSRQSWEALKGEKCEK